MCIIAYKPPASAFDYDALYQCWVNNPDGAGFMWREDGRVHILKGFWDMWTLWDFLSEITDKEMDVAVHFRIATSGRVDDRGCHPHAIGNSGLAHNGIIQGAWTKRELKGASDTMLFVRDIVSCAQKVDGKLLDNILNVVALSSNSKFALMTPAITKLYGEGWVEDRGTWYSNESYLPLRAWMPFSTTMDWVPCIDDTNNARYDCPACGNDGMLQEGGGYGYCVCPDCGQVWEFEEPDDLDKARRSSFALPIAKCDGCEGVHEDWVVETGRCNICGLPVSRRWPAGLDQGGHLVDEEAEALKSWR